MINLLVVFGVLLLLLICNVTCNKFKCRETNLGLLQLCTIDAYTSKLEIADTFILDPTYETVNITNLKFINSKVTYMPNEIFTNLEHLRNIDLSGSQVVIFTELTFENSSNLIELILSHNLVTELKDAVFDSANYLEIIDLSYNQIETINSKVFKNLNYLKKLDLSHNYIKIESTSMFPAYLSLLNLDSNQIVNFSISDLTSIEQIILNKNELVFLKINSYLKSLQADNNKLESKNLFFNQSNLNSLSLKYNLLINFNFVNNMLTLSYLNLSNNPKNGDSNIFSTLTNLKTLILKSSNLSESDIELFSELRNLETLDISSNNLNYINFNAISQLENLKNLKLNNNNLHSQTFNEFDYLFPELNTVDISENNWICADLITVLTKLQKLKINIDDESEHKFNVGTNIRGIQCTNITKDLNVTQNMQIINGIRINNVLLKTKLNDILQTLNDRETARNNVIVVNVTQNDYDDGLIENKLINMESVIISQIEFSFFQLYDIKVYLIVFVVLLSIVIVCGLFLIYKQNRMVYI